MQNLADKIAGQNVQGNTKWLIEKRVKNSGMSFELENLLL